MLENNAISQGDAQWLGEDIDYIAAWDFQQELHAKRSKQLIKDTLIFLTHSPIYTTGRRVNHDHILAELGAPLIETDRGGLITYHGPGQLTGYPIIDLKRLNLGPRRYVYVLETTLINTLIDYGIEAFRHEKLTGVWTTKGKIAAIGIKIANGITTHGFALNITTSLDAYAPIIACGIENGRTTSMNEFNATPSIIDVAHNFALKLGEELAIEWTWS